MQKTEFSLQRLLNSVKQQLAPAYGAQEAAAMAYLLLEHYCNKSKTALLLAAQEQVPSAVAEKVNAALPLLLQMTPIQHILGYSQFCNCRIEVNEHVLIPRPETEELTAWILDDARGKQVAILDIGTGSGCIAIALAKNLPQANVSAWDVSAPALAVAKKNAALNQAQVCYQQHDALRLAAHAPAGQWHIIVSNPPYICDCERPGLPPNVLHDPALALFVPNHRPLLFYEHIADFALQHLHPQGFLYFEINEIYGKETQTMLHHKGFCNVALRQDLNRKDRMIRAQLPPLTINN